jgi:hypothetical protein
VPVYDIRVDMHTKENPIKLIYKAIIGQDTGEVRFLITFVVTFRFSKFFCQSWEDVPLTLETATPTFGLEIPTLSPWKLSIYKPAPPVSGLNLDSLLERGERLDSLVDRSSALASSSRLFYKQPRAVVTSHGNVNATFRVPGRVTIPCDNEAHNFTIVELELSAVMSWVVVPKKDTRMHLKVTPQDLVMVISDL